MRTTTDFGNWNNLWEEVENVEHVEEVTENKDKVHESIDMDEEQQDAAAFLLGRW